MLLLLVLFRCCDVEQFFSLNEVLPVDHLLYIDSFENAKHVSVAYTSFNCRHLDLLSLIPL